VTYVPFHQKPVSVTQSECGVNQAAVLPGPVLGGRSLWMPHRHAFAHFLLPGRRHPAIPEPASGPGAGSSTLVRTAVPLLRAYAGSTPVGCSTSGPAANPSGYGIAPPVDSVPMSCHGRWRRSIGPRVLPERLFGSTRV